MDKGQATSQSLEILNNQAVRKPLVPYKPNLPN